MPRSAWTSCEPSGFPPRLEAARNIEQAIEQLVNTPAHRNAVQADIAALLRLAGRDTAALPQTSRSSRGARP